MKVSPPPHRRSVAYVTDAYGSRFSSDARYTRFGGARASLSLNVVMVRLTSPVTREKPN
jgi:hypothetical protein